MSSFDSPLSNKDLAMLMMKHGIVCRNDEEMLLLEKRITAIGYYRLEEYSWQFRKTNPLDKSKRTSYFKQKIIQYDAVNSTWAPCLGQSPALSFNPRDTAFIFLLCGFWLDRVAQTSHWKNRVESLMQPQGKLLKAAREAGFCIGWEKHPLWR